MSFTVCLAHRYGFEMGGYPLRVVYSLTIGLGMEATFNSFVSQGDETFHKVLLLYPKERLAASQNLRDAFIDCHSELMVSS
jgi:hypothetical protein